MSIMDTIRARLGGASQQASTTPGGAAATASQNAGQQPLTMAGLLKQMVDQRPGLEDRFTPEALLFAGDLRTARKIKPEAEASAVYEYLTARCDDAQFGNKVVFYQIIDGAETEVEGTRVQQVQERYARMAPHSLTEEAVESVQSGRRQAVVLPVTGVQAVVGQRPGAQAAQAPEGGAEMTEEQVLASTPQGQGILARRKATTPAASTAVN